MHCLRQPDAPVPTRHAGHRARRSRAAAPGHAWAAWRTRDASPPEILHVLEHDVHLGPATLPDDWVVCDAVLHAGPDAMVIRSFCYPPLLNGVGHPSSWTTILLTSLHKKGDPYLWTHFRGVAKAAVLLQVFERVLKNRFDGWCSVFNPVC